MGVIEGNAPVSDNDWETVKKGGNAAIEKWIADQLTGKSCAVVLVGAQTASRKRFAGDLRYLAAPPAFQSLCQKLAPREWVVYAKPPFGGPERVLKYLARYTHRVAISNHRLRSLENGNVSFAWKDYAHRNQTIDMTLDAVEFMRRFLLHVLPSGFVRHPPVRSTRQSRPQTKTGSVSRSACRTPTAHRWAGQSRSADRRPASLPRLRARATDRHRTSHRSTDPSPGHLMTPAKRSVFVELNGTDQEQASGLSSDRTSARQTCGPMHFICSLRPRTSETHRPSHRFLPVIRQYRQETAFNPHRFVPAQFNEFYRQCSCRPILRFESFCTREHSR